MTKKNKQTNKQKTPSNQAREKTQVSSDTSGIILDWYPAETEEFALPEDNTHSFAKWLLCCGPAQTPDRLASYCWGRRQGGASEWETDLGRTFPGAARNERKWAIFSLVARLSNSCTLKTFQATSMATRPGPRGRETCLVLWFIWGGGGKNNSHRNIDKGRAC